MICLDCGEPLDDYGPCACILDARRTPATDANRRRKGPRSKVLVTSMRAMVTRKLEKKNATKPND